MVFPLASALQKVGEVFLIVDGKVHNLAVTFRI